MALEAFRVVKESHPGARLDIVGSGAQEAELKSWVAAMGLEDVFFFGAVPNEEIARFLKTADILLNPSNVDNMPISLLEAFAFGVPVISTRAGGIPDLVGEERAALLVEPGNYLQMAEKINELVNEPEIANRLTAYAKDLCKDFTWDSVRSRLLEVYYPAGGKAGKELTTQRIR
jgi:glycosyltransferase involved in cell wall biosynthesis